MDLFSLLSLIVFGLIVFYTLRRIRRPTLSQKLEELARRLGVEPEYGSREGPAPDQPWGRSTGTRAGTRAGAGVNPGVPPTPFTSKSDTPRRSTDAFHPPLDDTFPSRAARRLGVHDARDLRRAVVLATVLDKCPGLSPYGDAAAHRSRD